MEFKGNFDLYVAHCCRMLAEPGMRDHGWYRVKELEKDGSGLWVGLREAVTKEMQNHRQPERKGVMQ